MAISGNLSDDQFFGGTSKGYGFVGTLIMDWPDGRDVDFEGTSGGDDFHGLDQTVIDDTLAALPWLVSCIPAWEEASAQQGFDPSPIT